MRKGVQKPFLFLFRKLKEEKGEIDMLLILFVTFMGISIIMSTLQPFITREKMVSLSKKVVEEVEFSGVIDSNTDSYIKTLIHEYGLDKNNIKYTFDGNIRSGGKIQLRDEFSFNIEGEQKIQIANFGEILNITLPIKKTVSGQSQVYYKPDEL